MQADVENGVVESVLRVTVGKSVVEELEMELVGVVESALQLFGSALEITEV